MISSKRLLVRIALCLCGAFALLAIAAAFYFKGTSSIEAWLVVPAALAVLTSLVAAWSAQINVEIQEDQLRPDVIVYLDGEERYSLLQIKMKNIGHSSAFRIRDHWKNDMSDYNGNVIHFTHEDDSVAVLHPSQSLSKKLDVPHKFFERYKGETYHGRVVFADAAGRSYETEFVIDPKSMAATLLYAEETARTHYDLQQIPKKLDEIKHEVKRLASIISRESQ